MFQHFQFALICRPNIPGFYAVLLFRELDFASITSHIHNWVLFLLWLCLFILSGVISPLISSTILGTCRPGEFIFQCPIFLPFHTVPGFLKARILKWFAIPPQVSLSHQEASISLLSFSIRGQTDWKQQSQKTNQSITWTTVLSNSMELWAMPCRASQDGWVMVENFDRMWSTW